jgi:hypothetical protein
MFDPLMVCSECGEPLTAKGVHVHPGPGARQPPKVVPPAEDGSKAKKKARAA